MLLLFLFLLLLLLLLDCCIVLYCMLLRCIIFVIVSYYLLWYSSVLCCIVLLLYYIKSCRIIFYCFLISYSVFHLFLLLSSLLFYSTPLVGREEHIHTEREREREREVSFFSIPSFSSLSPYPLFLLVLAYDNFIS